MQSFNIGDTVLARWSDTRYYQGKIRGVNPNGSYRVKFYDGLEKSVQAGNIREMPEELRPIVSPQVSFLFAVCCNCYRALSKGQQVNQSSVVVEKEQWVVCYAMCQYLGTVMTLFYYAIRPARGNWLKKTKKKTTRLWIRWLHITSVCVTNEKDMAFQRQNLINICHCIVVQ